MSASNLSKSIADATHFLFAIHADVRAMLVSLEAALDRAGWLPWAKKVSRDLSPTLQGEWVLWQGHRYYSPKTDGDTFDRLIAVVFNLAQPDDAEHDYATLLAAAVRFPQPTTPDEVYNSWADICPVYRATLGRPGVCVLAQPDFKDLFPHASAVAAVALPLCSLTGEDELRTKVIEPILAAEAALGAQS